MDNAPHELPRAEDLNYWMTSTKSPDTWIDKAIKEIENAGGSISGHAFGCDSRIGCAGYMLEFELGGDRFRVCWPVLPAHESEAVAARRQAATMLYHEVKSRAVAAKVLGGRVAFFSYLMLPGGRSATELANRDLAKSLPAFMSDQKAIE